MKDIKEINLDLKNSFDELFMTDEGRAENKLPKIYDIHLDAIDPFPNHPFKVIEDDEDMLSLVESIKEQGLITPVILRKKDNNRYEIVSGHRRTAACRLAGLQTVKAEIRDMTRDEAIILMVDSNLQRSKILPSEKAKSYKMKLDAMNRQGKRGDLTSGPVGQKFKPLNSRDELAGDSPDSARQIQRYIRLNDLIPEILEMVDEGRIAFRPAVEISYLSKNEQRDLLEIMESELATPSLSQAIRLKDFSREGRLTQAVTEAIMSEEKPNQKEKYTFKAETLRKYIPSDVPINQTEDYIIKALDYYQKFRKRQKEQER